MLIAVVALSYAAFTNHIWEDYYITYRSSKNLATGHGLVYQSGERVHVFTSPFNVLIPAAFSRLIGNRSDEFVIWAFRLLSLGLLAGAWLNLRRAMQKWKVGGGPVLFLLLLLAFECKIVAFSMNGQEAAFMVFFLSAGLPALTESQRRWINVGWVLAGLMYTRPDGFIYGGALAAGFLLFPARGSAGEERRKLVRDLLKGTVLALLIYSPWLVWSAWYYGSPIPHTVIAKSSPLNLIHLFRNLIWFPLELVLIGFRGRRIIPVFAPINYLPMIGDWPGIIYTFAHYTGLVSALYWIFPFAGRPARGTSFAFFLSLYYLYHVTGYWVWYMPAAAVPGLVTLALIADDMVRFKTRLSRRGARTAAATVRAVSIAGAVSVSAGVIALFGLTAYQIRVQQYEVEIGNRKAIGLWLRENARTPDDTVLLEPLGYIGYYSGLKMYDYPGLSSPEIVAVRREFGIEMELETLLPAIKELKPVWLVLRPIQEDRIRRADPAFLPNKYRFEIQFNATKRIKAYGWIPGKRYLDADAVFNIYSRRAGAAPED